MKSIPGSFLKLCAVALVLFGLASAGCKQAGPPADQAVPPATPAMMEKTPAEPVVQRGYAPVNGLKMYYEIHGAGEPLVLVHGAFMTIEAWGDILTGLARGRQVIAVELQGHGRTADIDRPFSNEQFADDVAALLRHVGIAKADIMGYSLGAEVALQFAIRHADMTDKLVVVSGTYRSDGWYPEVGATIAKITPESFTGSVVREGYDKVAPDPKAFPALVERIKALEAKPYAWPEEAIRAIASPALIVIGDSDGVRPEHAVAMFRLLGGGVFGDIAGLPKSQLAILPGTFHFVIMLRGAWLVPMVADFLDGKTLQVPVPK
jgi:pimeloyl-ACP methyl ester carboxylesterase